MRSPAPASTWAGPFCLAFRATQVANDAFRRIHYGECLIWWRYIWLTSESVMNHDVILSFIQGFLASRYC